jgi:hypothetical protein
MKVSHDTLRGSMAQTNRHRWRFFRAGGVDQVQLRNGADLEQLGELDRKLWIALAMPAKGVELDTRTLELIDSDKDGRVRAPELLTAVRWALDTLKDPEELIRGGGDSVPLAALRDGPVLDGARRILTNLGRASADAIALEDVRDTARIFAATRFNGDGVVPADAAEDEATRKAIEDILQTQGSVPDRSGKPGIDRKRADAFFAEAQAYLDWQDKAAREALPAGDGTVAAAQAVAAVRHKVEDFFTRCRVAAFDPRGATALNASDADLAALASRDLAPEAAEVARLPLSRVEGGRGLPLGDGINPAWSGALARLRRDAVVPILQLDKGSITEVEWESLKTRLAPFDAWWSQKPQTAVEPLGLPRLRALAADGARDKVNRLIDEDAALEKENAQIEAVERIILFRRDLFRLLNNFVSFSDFYGRRGAVFQAGTLFLDGRGCNLCIEVSDPAKHGLLAGMAGAFLAYCECTRGGEKKTIAAAFTDGDADNLLVGRNGVFYDRKGRDWDATITKIVSNPISIREAFWSPYKKFIRMVEEQVGKRAAAAEQEANARVSAAATATAHIDRTQREEKKIDVGTVAAIGVAIGGIGAMVTGILGSFFGLGLWMPLGVIALVLMISGPSMMLAYIKLRRRSLGPILDANGWAINGRAMINVPFGGALTDVAHLPAGAERLLTDPYAEKRRPWRLYFFLLLSLVLAGAWYLGKVDRYLPEPARSTSVLGKNAPAAADAK